MSETMTDPLLGRVIDGRYEVRDRVAAGGMATVYLAFDRRLERDVALKVMHPHLAADASEADFVSRFRREAKAAARLTHPGMVRVYDQGVDGELSYLTMEYVAGENLREYINREGPLPVGEALDIVEKVLAALSAAHSQGLVHRDLKPENVLLDSDGEPKLTDFGLARAVTEVTSTTTGTLLGTVAYLAPELVTYGTSDMRSDVYACGVLLYELITGRQPFTAHTALALAARNVHEDIPAPSSQVAWLPGEVDDVVAQFTARNPDARPDDAAGALILVKDLHSSLDDPTLARAAARPSGATPVAVSPDDGATTVIEEPPSGSTIALPIGLDGSAIDLEVYSDNLSDDDPEATEPDQTSHRTAWWIAAIVAAVLVLASAGVWWYQAVGPGAYTTVPDVAGQTEQGATDTLENLGFTVDVNNVYDDAIAAGYVVSTDPSGQERALDGAQIAVNVSEGKEQLEIPSVVGSSQDEAEQTLTDAGFTVGDPLTEYSDTAPEGEVLNVSPEAGEVVDHDTVIELTVSDGPEPITIPDLIGMRENASIVALQEYGIDPEVEYGRTDEVEPGRVYVQSPDAGADGVRTQEMTITVSEGYPLVTIPDVRGDEYQDAKATLEGLGLTVSGDDNPWNFTTRVYTMDPAPGSDVERGTNVYLEY
ncbi:Stk1 family PASTA domain-containing Ser/Thr kinase [Demequina flava]|uniref:Stk1 family PASTA domain-containing Ser/Thr kinase n=1 Tax=Demequina flava TaxID=1095025 RepID=UPI00128C6325|nr:Stk1 family PASTA domain-containing Ser/Thr kinase [Demequina flava]